MTGFNDTVIRKQAYLNLIANTIQTQSEFTNLSNFPAAGPGVTTGGDQVAWLIDYASTNNGGAMSTIADPGPSSDTLERIGAYQNKDYFQNAALVYDILISQVETNKDGNKVPGVTYMGSALENAAKNMASDIAEAMAADLLAMIDSAGNFSDAALLRSTYNLASYEGTSVGTLALSDMDTAIDTLKTKEYGRAKRQDLQWMMSGVNHTRVANLSSGLSNYQLNAASDGTGNIDGGVAHRVASYQGIEILEEDSLGNGDILLLRKGTVLVSNHWLPGIKDVNLDAWQEKKNMGQGSNIIVMNPRWNAKLSGITA